MLQHYIASEQINRHFPRVSQVLTRILIKKKKITKLINHVTVMVSRKVETV